MTIEEVRKCQLKQLEALKFIDRVCRENALQFFVHTGTLLGAVRHHGYIPWDMDTDILMPMEDTKQFMRIVRDMNDPIYSVIYENESWSCSDRLIAKTAKCYGEAASCEEDQYIHVDIYSFGPANVISTTKKKYYSMKTRILHRLIEYRMGRELFQSRVNKLIIEIEGILNRRKSNQDLRTEIKRVALSDKDTGYITVYNSFYGFSVETYPKQIYLVPEYIQFEDMIVPVPSQYEEVLSSLYGDWKTLPPENQRYPSYLSEMIYEEL